MTRWTKPEHYTAKALAWQVAKERLRGEPITGIWIDEAGNLSEEMIRGLIPPKFVHGDRKWVIESKSLRPPRFAGFDIAKGRDKSATWNGRKWILD